MTGKLSREFYDRLGDKVVDEPVGLLIDEDAIFKAELREGAPRGLTAGKAAPEVLACVLLV